jgi:hypothetical protein
MRALAAAALAAAALAACRSPSDLGPFDIRLVLDDEGGCDPDRGCADYGMSCGAALLYRIVDLEAGEVVDGVPSGEVVESRCEVLEADLDICGVGELDTFRAIPPHRIQIQVAAWRPELVTVAGAGGLAEVRCPSAEAVFSANGNIRPELSPQPAFGGVAEFDVASDATEVEVPLACPDADQLESASCTNSQPTLVTALITDLESTAFLTAEQASDLTVSVREPNVGAPTTLSAADAIRLQPSLVGGTPTFFAQIPNFQVDGTLCALTLELAPQATAAVVCEAPDPDAAEDMRLMRPLFVPRATLDDVLDALGTPFPDPGLLIGRVLDADGAPLAGVTVTPAAGTVGYLSADRTTLGGGATTASGYFVSTDVPFGTAFTALHADDRREDGSPIGGLIEGQLGAMVIRMQP